MDNQWRKHQVEDPRKKCNTKSAKAFEVEA